jgi:hypothetical protein
VLGAKKVGCNLGSLGLGGLAQLTTFACECECECQFAVEPEYALKCTSTGEYHVCMYRRV